MTSDDFFEFIKGTLRIWANRHGEIKRCQRCGRDYRSAGKNDPRICPECLRETTFIGGPLDDKYRS